MLDALFENQCVFSDVKAKTFENPKCGKNDKTIIKNEAKPMSGTSFIKESNH